MHYWPHPGFFLVAPGKQHHALAVPGLVTLTVLQPHFTVDQIREQMDKADNIRNFMDEGHEGPVGS